MCEAFLPTVKELIGRWCCVVDGPWRQQYWRNRAGEDCFERGTRRGAVYLRVVSLCEYVAIHVPLFRVVAHIVTKIFYDGAIEPFHQTITVWMVSSGEEVLHPEDLTNVPKKTEW